MKLSSRKQLLHESDLVLNKIRKEIYSNKINEDNYISSFFTDLVKSITSSISIWITKKRKEKINKTMPYLMGLDLVNRNNLNLNVQHLNNLEKIINEIIEDIGNSTELKSALIDIQKLEYDVTEARRQLWIAKNITPRIYRKENIDKRTVDYKEAIENYDNLVKQKVEVIIKDILKTDKYKNFQERVIGELESGLNGLKDSEILEIKNKYLKTISQRAINWINKYKVHKTYHHFEPEWGE
jgi:hypothetical protein